MFEMMEVLKTRDKRIMKEYLECNLGKNYKARSINPDMKVINER